MKPVLHKFELEEILKSTKNSRNDSVSKKVNSLLDIYNNLDVFMSFMYINGEYLCGCDSGLKFQFVYDYKYSVVSIYASKGDYHTMFTVSTMEEMYNEIDDRDMPLRICGECGAPMTDGYTNDCGDFHYCSDYEFKKYMDQLYGPNMWRPEPTGQKEWNYEHYENGIWKKDSSYYTEW